MEHFDQASTLPSAACVAARMADVTPFHVMELLKRAGELEAQGHDIVHMEVGEPDFPTPATVLAEASKFLSGGHVHYTPALGIPELRLAVAKFYQQRYGLALDPQRVIITAGASGALLLALGILVDPGDEILLTDPGYPCNRNIVRVLEGVARPLPVCAETDYQPTVEQIAAAWTTRTKGVLIASPANPTGTIIDTHRLRAFEQLSAERGGALLVDEIYHGLTYGFDIQTVLGVAEEAFVINSFSKYFGMTGWRLGWLIVPARYVRDIEKMAQNLFISPSTPAQYAALAAFQPDTIAILEKRRGELQARRNYLLPALEKLKFRVDAEPRGAFYIYADIAQFGMNSQDFAHRLIEQAGVAITPGLDFGVNGADRHVRFAYTTSLERLREGVRRIAHFLKQTDPD